MPFDIEIAEHEIALAALRAQQKQERVAETKKQLLEIRARLAPARAEHARLTAALPILDEARLGAQKRVLAILEAIADHQRSRPPSADFLSPDEDAEVGQWQRRHDELVALRDEASRSIPPPPPHIRQAELANEIQQLQHAERHCIERLRGGLGEFPRGGIFGV